MARRRFFDEATLTQLREMPASDALGLLAIHVKADPSYVPVKSDRSRRWHVLTTRGEFEILTTGCQWREGELAALRRSSKTKLASVRLESVSNPGK